MKLIKTTGRDQKAAYALLATLERRGAVKTAEVEPTVRRIMQDVRKGGDKALLKLAAKLDALQPKQPLRVNQGEMLDAWNATPQALRDAMQTAADNSTLR